MTVTHGTRKLGEQRQHSTNVLSTASTDAVLRTTGVLALVGVALVHFVQIVETFNQDVWLGLAFVALIVASIGSAVLLVGSSSQVAWASAIVVAAAAILGYVFTRSLSTPFDNADVGNWSENLGLAALFVEGMLLSLGVHSLVAGRPIERAVRLAIGTNANDTARLSDIVDSGSTNRAGSEIRQL